MSAVGLIQKYGRALALTRACTGGDYVKGNWVPAPSETLNIVASVQPVNGRDLRMLPEGSHAEEHLKLYTIEELQPKRPGKSADKFVYKGSTYEIILVKTYDVGVTSLNHSMSIAARIPND